METARANIKQVDEWKLCTLKSRSSLNCYGEQFKPDSKVNVWFIWCSSNFDEQRLEQDVVQHEQEFVTGFYVV